jgi:hypothetical protein
VKTPRTLRAALAAVVLTGGLGAMSACTVEDDDEPATVVEDNDGGGTGDAPDVNNEAPDVNIDNDGTEGGEGTDGGDGTESSPG